jgi:RND family efflux transporter MFP subunit
MFVLNKFYLVFFTLFIIHESIAETERSSSGFLNDKAVSDVTARGVILARNEAILASNVNAQVLEMPYFEGDFFNKGDLLVQFDCRKPYADMKSAIATEKLKQQKLMANQELFKYDSISTYEVEVSKAELVIAQAEKEALQSYLAGCKVLAPFDGRVRERMVNKFEMVAANEPLISIIDDSHLEVALILPSRWLQWLKVGQAFEFSIDELKQSHSAEVVRVSPTVDPASRTVKVMAKIKEGEASKHGILSGMSGVASFRTKTNGDEDGS